MNKTTDTIKITIDGLALTAQKGETILSVAQKNKIYIPALCHHPDVKIQASCRLCSVEIKGRPGLVTACSTEVVDGMEIVTDSPSIRLSRLVNLQLIFTEHCEECNDCILKRNCLIKDLAQKYQVPITRFVDRKQGFPVHEFGKSLIFQSSKCIDCGLCVDVCHQEGVDFLEYKKVGDFWQVCPSADKNKDCIYCGQCLVHCPVGAFEAVGEFEDIAKPLQEKNKIVVFQFAPSIRAAIGEEFDLPHGTIVTGQLVAGIHRLGIKYVFDVSVGADVTTMEEASELVERIKNGGRLPMFTACCPAWVKYVEFFTPELVPNMTTVRSPQIIMGGLIKTYWAKKQKINPKDIVVVSVMPCVAKKYEKEKPELKINGLKPVDYVMTTRELAWLFKANNIDLKNLPSEEADPALGIPTGAGVIYGASGGVMESALRTAYYKLTGQHLRQLDFKEVRGLQGFKRAAIKIGDRTLRVAVVNQLTNGQKIIEELKKNPQSYDYVEVMACPGGCIGGGGQPVPVNTEIRRKRAESLYRIDAKKEIRAAEDSDIVKTIYGEFMNDKQNAEKVAHTKYRRRNKEVYPVK
ncbi:MAG: [FeFe] hydrogenase, group A [Patescibacteria group bacterium]